MARKKKSDPPQPLTLTEFANLHEVSASTVRRWVRDGYLTVTYPHGYGRGRHARVSGYPPVSLRRWREAIETHAIELGLPRHLYGFESDGDVLVLDGTERVHLDRVTAQQHLEVVLKRLRTLAAKYRQNRAITNYSPTDVCVTPSVGTITDTINNKSPPPSV